jgi:hypothetical protein
MSDYPPPPPGPGEPQDPGSYRPQPGEYPPGYPAQPGYPGEPYSRGYGYPPGQPAYPPYPPQQQPPANAAFLAELPAKLGERLVRRPEPRFTVALAGVGAALALAGVAIWAGTYLGHGLAGAFGEDGSGPSSTDRNLLGAALFAVLAVVGYVLAVSRRDGPLATSGAVLGALGIPLTIGFLTFDLASSSDGFPVNLDALTWVSIIAWLVSYFFVPGMRGRTFLLFLAATFFYDYVLFRSAKSDVGVTINATVNGGVGRHFTGLGTIAAVGLIFGLGYYAIAFALDRRAKHGPATGLLYPGFNATLTGILASADALKVTGAAVLGLVISVALSWYAGRFGRRLTCFVWGAGAGASVVVILADNIHDGIGLGIAMALIGAAVIVGAALAAIGLREPADLDPALVVRSR